jgi:hypothetical protein
MERVDKYLKKMIYKNISFVVDNKVIKHGFIRVFNTKQNFIKFRFETENSTKEWELTYPYKIHVRENYMIFDYCLSAFCPKNEDSYWKMLLMDKSESSNLHNNYLYVRELSST